MPAFLPGRFGYEYVPTFLDDVEGRLGGPDGLDEEGGERTLLVVCKVGMRSGAACRELETRGWRVENLEGGMDLWLSQGREVVWGGEGEDDEDDKI